MIIPQPIYIPLADVIADICDLPFQDNQYDLILCNHVLEHVTRDLKAMAELYRVLKKGGTLIAQVPISEEDQTHFKTTILLILMNVPKFLDNTIM